MENQEQPAQQPRDAEIKEENPAGQGHGIEELGGSSGQGTPSLTKLFNLAGIGIFIGMLALVVGVLFLLIQKLTSSQMECVPQQCHGFEFTCGIKGPKACDDSYMMGDRCRQYAKCSIEEGKCMVVYSEKFYACRDCVKECKKLYIEDPISYSNCEASCGMGKGFS